MANDLDTAQGMIALLKGDNHDLLARADADAITVKALARERDAAIAERDEAQEHIAKLQQERDALRAQLVLSDHEFAELRADLGQQITVWAAIAQRDEAQDAMRMLKHVLAAVSEMHTITQHVRDRRVTAARGIKQIAACCQFAMQALEQRA